jgi:hypothetical protein
VKIFRGKVRVILISLFLLFIIILGGGYFFLQSERALSLSKRILLAQLGNIVEGEIKIGEFRGDLLSGISLKDVQILREGDPIPVLDIAEVIITYNIFKLPSRILDIKSMKLIEPEVMVCRYKDGSLNLSDILAKREVSGKRIIKIDLSKIEIEKGRVIVKDEMGTIPHSVMDIALASSYVNNLSTNPSFTGQVSLSSLVVGGNHLKDVQFRYSFADDKAKLFGFSAEVFGGDISGKGEISLGKGGNEFEVNVKLNGMDIGELFAHNVPFLEPWFGGIAEGECSLRGAFGDFVSIMEEGEGLLRVRKGLFIKYPFQDFSTKFKIRKGILLIDEIRASDDQAEAIGKGFIDMATGDM